MREKYFNLKVIFVGVYLLYRRYLFRFL